MNYNLDEIQKVFHYQANSRHSFAHISKDLIKSDTFPPTKLPHTTPVLKASDLHLNSHKNYMIVAYHL